ncbi:MAG: hypothetical protein K6U87_06805 [Firmicutes bacterium]|nr:hypothetical protein [Bacillota bacterium]
MANTQNNDTAQIRQMIRQELARMGAGGTGATSGTSQDGSSSLSAAEIQAIVRQELQSLQQGQTASQNSQAQGGSQAAGAGAGNPNPQPQGSQRNDTSPSATLGRRISRLLSGSAGRSSNPAQNASQNRTSANGAAGARRATVQPKAAATAQSVAGVLTQAQYELSQELEANLKKLKAVIRESQEIARKIELVLGKGQGGSGSSNQGNS